MSSKPVNHLTPEYIAEYMKKLEWLENNPVKLQITNPEIYKKPRRTRGRLIIR